MKKIFLILSFCVFVSCNNNKKTETKDSKTEIQSKTTGSDLEQLKTESSRLRAGGSIKSVEFENGKATIYYVKNFAEYKELNPQSNLTKNDLKEYWSSGNAIQKAMIEGSVRLMKTLSFINEVEIILPFENNVYKIDVKKAELEKFTGKDFSEITKKWTESFIDPYVYDSKGREKFFNKFGTQE
ncbi:hypothetical protein [Chryseobacterium indologenes]|uniref:hypothetical protein n=1 Tax=Chryseobacterium indologenes TaxID=253 RepID=UPI0009A23720|nr:hypothetical protein [Chryseobacterium indologenes]